MTDNSTPHTTPDLGAIRARLATITPGEWCNAPHIAAVLTCDEADLICAEVEPQDAAFIAAAPADIRYLLKRIAELELEVEMLRDWIEDEGE
jgi:hypothetical protein